MLTQSDKELIRAIVKEVLAELEEQKKPRCSQCGQTDFLHGFLKPEGGIEYMHANCHDKWLKSWQNPDGSVRADYWDAKAEGK